MHVKQLAAHKRSLLSATLLLVAIIWLLPRGMLAQSGTPTPAALPIGDPPLQVNQSVAPGYAAPGEQVTFLVGISSSADTPRQITARVSLDAAFVLTDASASAGSCTRQVPVTCEVRAKREQPASLTITVQVRPEVAPGIKAGSQTLVQDELSNTAASDPLLIDIVPGAVVGPQPTSDLVQQPINAPTSGPAPVDAPAPPTAGNPPAPTAEPTAKPKPKPTSKPEAPPATEAPSEAAPPPAEAAAPPTVPPPAEAAAPPAEPPPAADTGDRSAPMVDLSAAPSAQATQLPDLADNPAPAGGLALAQISPTAPAADPQPAPTAPAADPQPAPTAPAADPLPATSTPTAVPSATPTIVPSATPTTAATLAAPTATQTQAAASAVPPTVTPPRRPSTELPNTSSVPPLVALGSGLCIVALTVMGARRVRQAGAQLAQGFSAARFTPLLEESAALQRATATSTAALDAQSKGLIEEIERRGARVEDRGLRIED